MTYTQDDFRRICSKFALYGDFLVAVPFGGGHVNDTFQLTFDQGGVRLHYVLQRINRNVFRKPEQVMENMDRVTRHLLAKIHAEKVETRKRTIRLLRTFANQPCVTDERGDVWRAYIFVENARAYDVLETPEQAFKVAQAFGEFQCNLVDLPGPRLHETIPDFHNTPKRLEALRQAIRRDPVGRERRVRREIDFIMKRADETERLLRLQAEGAIPERITHNDTKVNNILIDDLTGDGICVIDLDTVMPGSSLYDFGDSIRFGAATAAEDEKDLSKMEMSLDRFRVFTRGYVCACPGLSAKELALLPMGAKTMTMECGVRFLTDYLDGDHYFAVHRDGQNLDRARTQFKLVADMEKKWDEMRKIVEEEAK